MYNRRSFAVTPRTIGGFFEDVLQNGWGQLHEEATSFHVPVNIQETDKSYELHVVAAGLKKEDFKLNIDKNILNISFEQKEEKQEQPDQAKWLRNEYRMRSFKRSFTLNDKVDTSKIAAKYANGILNISLPKKEVSEPATHEISVN
ncbi:MAG: Hsp20/alpha crystallin family protein [Flavipsychrobacter sp.]|nr:Hsp20/alpha crystallin family protein [Flavipsychrobacter sp.]